MYGAASSRKNKLSQFISQALSFGSGSSSATFHEYLSCKDSTNSKFQISSVLQARMRGLHGLDDLRKVVIAITEDKCEILRNMNISDEVLAAMRFEDNMNVLNLAID